MNSLHKSVVANSRVIPTSADGCVIPAITIGSVIPTEAQRSGGICFSPRNPATPSIAKERP